MARAIPLSTRSQEGFSLFLFPLIKLLRLNELVHADMVFPNNPQGHTIDG